ncbi:MAG: hypothetical protein II180_05230 [Proteobacteria bacterium]|nr:hypothetical protein [Pseudomonadota bacterium]
MANSNFIVTDALKETTAITVMRCMLMSYARDNHISFEQALLDFAKSDTYEALFDLETEIWKEGPTYLKTLYEKELNNARSNTL